MSSLLLKCRCGIDVKRLIVQKANENKGRAFHTCAQRKCHYFAWADKLPANLASASSEPLQSHPSSGMSGTKRKFSSVDALHKSALNSTALDLNLNAPFSTSTRSGSPFQASSDFLDRIRRTMFIFTDGSAYLGDGVASSTTAAGWGFVAVRPNAHFSSPPESLGRIAAHGLKKHNCDVICTMFGPVIVAGNIKHKHLEPFWIGAEVGSNNTGELSAVGEALLWVTSFFRSGTPSTAPLGSPYRGVEEVVICYDSAYAAKVATGEFNGPKNPKLVSCVRQLLQHACAAMKTPVPTHVTTVETHASANKLQFVHVRAHNKHYWNELADELALQGCNGRISQQGRYATKPPVESTTSASPLTTSSSASLKPTATSATESVSSAEAKVVSVKTETNVPSSAATAESATVSSESAPEKAIAPQVKREKKKTADIDLSLSKTDESEGSDSDAGGVKRKRTVRKKNEVTASSTNVFCDLTTSSSSL